LPRRPVSEALCPRYEPPHAYKLLGDVILGLSYDMLFSRPNARSIESATLFFIVFTFQG
jgi:hypothetical protein